MLELEFIVEKDRLKFFCSFFGREYTDDLIEESSIFLSKVKRNWQENQSIFENRSKVFFEGLNFGPSVKVSILPEYFKLGCSNTDDRLILFGQPIRSKNFSSAIITHELCHILLKSNGYQNPPIIDEVLAMLSELPFYRNGIDDLDKIWPDAELDEFHLAAKKIIINNHLSLDKNFRDHIRSLEKTLSKDLLAFRPKVGLLRNLTT